MRLENSTVLLAGDFRQIWPVVCSRFRERSKPKHAESDLIYEMNEKRKTESHQKYELSLENKC